MIGPEENKLLTKTGPGTPMGKLMREYWIPAFLASEIPTPDSPLLKVLLLGEKLIAFRNSEKDFGLIQEKCPHRGASLSFAEKTKSGIKCAYHGLEFDTRGHCAHLPDGKSITYPCRERGGIVWAYLGEEKDHPPLPDIPMNMNANSHELVQAVFSESNWLQNLEASIDIYHLRGLHGELLKRHQAQRPHDLLPKDLTFDYLTDTPAQKIEVKDTEGGFAIAACEEVEPGGDLCWGIGQFIFPFYAMLPSHTLGNHWMVAIVPMDDENCMIYGMSMSVPYYTSEVLAPLMFGPHPYFLPHSDDWYGRFRLTRNASNNYGYNPEANELHPSMSSGVLGQIPQDLAICHSMGRIAPRNNENLTSQDLPVIHLRKRLLSELESGKLRPGVKNPSAYKAPQGSVVISKNQSWFEEIRKLIS